MPKYLVTFDEGNTSGPFDVYLSGSSGLSLYEANVTKNELLAGYVIDFPDGIPSSSAVFENVSFGCSNEQVLPFPTPTPSITPSISITPSKTPSISISPSITPSLTPTVTPSITRTPTRTVTPSITASVTPSLSIGVTPTPTPSVTVTRTPSITPTISKSTPVVYAYADCGYGSTEANACTDAAINLRVFYSDCNTGAFGTGCTVYYPDQFTILTGYDYVYMNGGVWELSPFGTILGYSPVQC